MARTLLLWVDIGVDKDVVSHCCLFQRTTARSASVIVRILFRNVQFSGCAGVDE
ncbi:MAG: hypothetical protein HGA67_02625 [Candidatus Yonathbacteria bacterium]|nr:hypothetical protein [Candidatus Yonathbacteria bacterium]